MGWTAGSAQPSQLTAGFLLSSATTYHTASLSTPRAAASPFHYPYYCSSSRCLGVPHCQPGVAWQSWWVQGARPVLGSRLLWGAYPTVVHPTASWLGQYSLLGLLAPRCICLCLSHPRGARAVPRGRCWVVPCGTRRCATKKARLGVTKTATEARRYPLQHTARAIARATARANWRRFRNCPHQYESCTTSKGKGNVKQVPA